MTLWVLVSCVSLVVSQESPEVSILQGRLQGTIVSTLKGKNIFSFYGIPFAQPPVGQYRFRPPEAPNPWKGLLNATVPGPPCLQHITQSFLTNGNEDCLYLNVFTPVLPNISNVPPWFPIIVFFHNGVFITGDTNLFGPQYLLDEDVILVTANYRLGVLGFLSTEDAVVPGNNGLKDQVAVLKWVQNNIKAFGGDKTRVTIAGNTAGAVSVHLHYLSPLSVGLFQSAIAQSGSALVPWAIAHNLREKTEFMADTLNCSTKDSRLMIDCLRTYAPQQLVLFSQSNEVYINTPFAPFGPCIERGGENPFLTEHPYKLLQNGSGLDLPILFSDCEYEGLYPLSAIIDNEKELDFLRRRWITVAPYLLNYNDTVTDSDKPLVSQIIWNFYINGRYLPRTDLSIIKLFGDRQFLADNGRAAALHARSNLFNPVYFYSFSYRGQRSNSDFYNPSTSGDYGAANGDDLLYILQDSRQFFNPPNTTEDLAMVDVMVKIWTSFATSGVPDIGEKTWIPVSSTDFEVGTLRMLKIAGPEQLSNSTKCDFGNFSFWNSLPLNEPGSGRTTTNSNK